MALSDDYDFRSIPSGPKRFTEYSFGAILVLVAQIGSFVCMAGQMSVVLPISWLISIVYPGGEVLFTGVIGTTLIAFFIGLVQLFLGYQLHTQGLGENNKITLLNTITIICEFIIYVFVSLSIGFLGLFLILQVSIAIIILNATSIYFLRTEEVQREFRRVENVG